MRRFQPATETKRCPAIEVTLELRQEQGNKGLDRGLPTPRRPKGGAVTPTSFVLQPYFASLPARFLYARAMADISGRPISTAKRNRTEPSTRCDGGGFRRIRGDS